MVNLEFAKQFWSYCKKHSTKILAGLAIGGEAAAIYFTAKEAPIAQKKLASLPKDATWWDKVKTAGPVYLPAIAMMALSMGGIVGGAVASHRAITKLEGLCSMSNAALAGYQKKVVDAIGKEKAQEIEDAVAKQLMEEKPPEAVNIIATGKGDQLIFDPLSGRYFTSSWSEVEKAAIKINKKILNDMWVTTNEWYAELGLEEIGLGDTSGWNVDHLMDIGSGAEKTSDDRSCLTICYYVRPVRFK